MKEKKVKDDKSLKSILLKVLLIFIGVFVLFGVFKGCVTSHAYVDELVGIADNSSYKFDDVITYERARSGADYSITADRVWFSCNGLEFNKIAFVTLFPEPVYRQTQLYFINTFNNSSIIVYNSSESGTLVNGSYVYSLTSSEWKSSIFRFITILTSDFNASSTSYFNTNHYLTFLTLFNEDLNSYSLGYDEGYNAGVKSQIDTVTNNAYTEGYNAGYNTGYDIGVNDGTSSGRVDGYSQGYDVGVSDGYSTGFNDGVVSTDTYTFKSLISAVIEVPVQTLIGLFNWDFLGVNLSSFFFTMLTIGVILFILKLIF